MTKRTRDGHGFTLEHQARCSDIAAALIVSAFAQPHYAYTEERAETIIDNLAPTSYLMADNTITVQDPDGYAYRITVEPIDPAEIDKY